MQAKKQKSVKLQLLYLFLPMILSVPMIGIAEHVEPSEGISVRQGIFMASLAMSWVFDYRYRLAKATEAPHTTQRIFLALAIVGGAIAAWAFWPVLQYIFTK